LVITTPFNKINEAVLNERKKEAKVIFYGAKDDYLQIVKKS
jgi:hypothetical protein